MYTSRAGFRYLAVPEWVALGEKHLETALVGQKLGSLGSIA